MNANHFDASDGRLLDEIALSICCEVTITRTYDGVICTKCHKWSATMPTSEPFDLFYLAARAEYRGDKAKAIEYGERAINLLLRDSPRAPIELELKLEKHDEPTSTAIRAA